MNLIRAWFGVRQYARADQLTPESSPEHIAFYCLRKSSERGNFNPPRGELGYWIYYRADNPTIPTFVYKSQGFRPHEKTWGAAPDDLTERHTEAVKKRASTKGPEAP